MRRMMLKPPAAPLYGSAATLANPATPAAPPLATEEATPVPAAPPEPLRRRLVIACDEADAATRWADELAAEGFDTVLRPLDDQALPEADALLLHLHTPLAQRLNHLRRLRAASAALPLVAAVRGLRDLDQVLALEMGADDAVDTRLPALVLAARLRALWRRQARPLAGDPEAAGPRELRFGTLWLSQWQREVRLADTRVPLTEGEFEVLWLLARHAGQALSRRDILRRVRGLDDHPTDRSIDSRVYRIRAKLGDDAAVGQRIRTVRHYGYAFSPQGW